MELSGIFVHPVKSTAIRSVREAQITAAGLAGDREWMVVDSTGDLVSARELPRLFHIVADTPATDPSMTAALRLRAEGHDSLELPQPDSALIDVRVHRTALRARPVGGEADAWLRAMTGREDLRLVWCDDPSRRRLNPTYTRAGDHTAFADSAPITLVSTASLDQLNAWVGATARERDETAAAPVPMARFRPNLVVEGVDLPFAEDGWQQVRIGDVTCRVGARTDRCVMTTIDVATLQQGREPIRTLARHRRSEGKTWFAVKLLPDGTGRIRVGDPVRAD